MPATVTQDKAAHSVVLHGVSWKLYEALVDELSEQHVFLTYDRGTLEIMSPLPKHEYYKKVLGRWIELLGIELGLNVRGGGSTTFRRENLERGLEPDECFWIASEAVIRDKIDLDFTVDPPPDLAIEIDVTSRLLDRQSIYAALGVPELWRCDGASLRVYVLQPRGTYRLSNKSPSFPSLPLGEFHAFLHKPAGMSEGEWVRTFRRWARKLNKR
ncbi:MAG: Uma2 family endonuclease [Planctomycetota bacterium]|nr:Uma2 family endonuclease [Planctomycetota bacterium]